MCTHAHIRVSGHAYRCVTDVCVAMCTVMCIAICIVMCIAMLHSHVYSHVYSHASFSWSVDASISGGSARQPRKKSEP